MGLAHQLLKAYDEVFTPFDALSVADKNNITALAKDPKWASFEKLMRNQVFKVYKDVLVDEDIKGAQKFVNFAASIYKLPKLNSYGSIQIDQEKNQPNQTDGWQHSDGSIEL